MSGATRAPRQRATRPTYNPRRSTAWTAVYDAPSASSPEVWMVCLNHRTGTVRCNCWAGRFNKPCHHVAEVRIADRERWWGNLIDSMTPEDQSAFLSVLTGRVLSETNTWDDDVALAVLAQREVRAA